jgi:UDP-N-acetylglucosamine transferase subunit ALG13
VEQQVNDLGIDLVISDNRYGFYSRHVPSWIVIHQLSPTTGLDKFSDKIVRKIHFKFLDKFDRCLVPDLPTNPGIAGKLSHPPTLPSHTHYLGPISRFPAPGIVEPSLDILVLLSGPEPSRSIFEKKLLPELRQYNGRYLLVRGLPGTDMNPEEKILSHADIPTLQDLLEKASIVICRSGYTSVMDLLRLQKKALLVPTPGQTEQEYLALHLEKEGYFPYLKQSDFTLEKALAKAETFTYRHFMAEFEQYKNVLSSLINT